MIIKVQRKLYVCPILSTLLMEFLVYVALYDIVWYGLLMVAGFYLIVMLLCDLIISLKDIVSWNYGYDGHTSWSIRPSLQY